MKGRPSDFRSVVAAGWRQATAHLMASREPCITVRDEEVSRIGPNRRLVALDAGDFDAVRRKGIWVLGVVVCPGDDLGPVAAWAKTNGIPPNQVWFFLHSDTGMEVLAPWAAAGFPTDQVDFVEDWTDLHPVFGLYLSDHIYGALAPDRPRAWTPGRRARDPPGQG